MATTPSPGPRRGGDNPWHVLMYVQHLSGIGHQHRSARIARALCARGLRVTYVNGGMPLPDLDTGASEHLQLEPVRARDQRYQELLDAAGQPLTEAFKEARRASLLAILEQSRADAVLVETFPFGRKLMRFELEAFVQRVAAMQPRPLLLSSVRDIIEPRSELRRYQPMAEWLERYFDRVLVHSDPGLFDFADTFPLYERIRDKVLYTGYISEAGIELQARPGRDPDPRYRGAVVVSAGGGATGGELLAAAVEARPLSKLRTRPWLLLVGPHLPAAEYTRLQAGAGEGIEIQRNQQNFREILADCLVSVSQAGYNTMLDLLSTGARTVLVPFARYNEREQLVRARHLEALGLAVAVYPEDLTPAALAAAIDAAAVRPQGPALDLDVNGAGFSASLIEALLRGDRLPVFDPQTRGPLFRD